MLKICKITPKNVKLCVVHSMPVSSLHQDGHFLKILISQFANSVVKVAERNELKEILTQWTSTCARKKMIHAKIILTVTEPHQMIVVGDNGERETINVNANLVVVGHKMLGREGAIYEVVQLEQLKLSVKYCIETESNSAIASGIFTSTKCLYWWTLRIWSKEKGLFDLKRLFDFSDQSLNLALLMLLGNFFLL